jgi:rhamnose utilization protein RhaD (predicted bifunctional aldolase and dehydrogenase)
VAHDVQRIVDLSRTLGDPARDLAILAEGNTSVRLDADRMLVKASGASMATVTASDFVEVEIAALTALIDDPDGDDATVGETFAAIEARCGRRPSVEAMLHAVCLTLGDADAVGHTHPVPVVGLLCSPHAEKLATHLLFPDQIVVLGRHPLYVPYVDPGLALARRVRDEMHTHRRDYGHPPKVIYLGNHGLFALGRTPADVLQVTDMAVKAAKVLATALAVGGAQPLSAEAGARIDSRPDEHYRRLALAGEQAARAWAAGDG